MSGKQRAIEISYNFESISNLYAEPAKTSAAHSLNWTSALADSLTECILSVLVL